MFAGEYFNVDSSLSPNDFFDFLISFYTEQITVETPAIVVVEAKKNNPKSV